MKNERLQRPVEGFGQVHRRAFSADTGRERTRRPNALLSNVGAGFRQVRGVLGEMRQAGAIRSDQRAWENGGAERAAARFSERSQKEADAAFAQMAADGVRVTPSAQPPQERGAVAARYADMAARNHAETWVQNHISPTKDN